MRNVCVCMCSNEQPWTLRRLLPWIVENLLSVDNPEMLMDDDGSVRPGILGAYTRNTRVRAANLAVLVNDTDWALLGTLDYVLRAHDRITFISTLHGG